MFLKRIIKNKIKEVENNYIKINIRIIKFIAFKKHRLLLLLEKKKDEPTTNKLNNKYHNINNTNTEKEISIIKKITYDKKLQNKKDNPRKINENKIPSIIYEEKIFSPIDGEINKNSKKIEKKYIKAISILTDKKNFRGELSKALKIKKVKIRKDFLIDKYQIYESKIYNYNYNLLIKEVLSTRKIKRLTKLSRKMGIEVLLENNKNGKKKKKNKNIKAKLIGINNRDLNSFTISFKEINKIIKKRTIIIKREIVSESGYKNKNEIIKKFNMGINYFLIGKQIRKNRLFFLNNNK